MRDGRSTRWDPHRQERRTSIIAAAVVAIERYGPDVLTGQIAELAGVPRTHVYRHFEGKPALDLAVSTHLARELGARIRSGLARGGSARQVIRGAIEQHLAWIEAHPNLYRFLAQHAYAVQTGSGAAAQGSARAIDAKAALADELSDLMRRYERQLGTTAALDAGGLVTERVVVGVVGLVDATAAWWLEHREPARSTLCDELTERALLVIARGVADLGLQLDPDRRLPSL